MNIKTNRQIFKTVAIAGTIVAPAAYITKKHVDFYPKSQPQRRASMRNRMIGFFAGMLPGLYMVHKAARSNLKHTKNMAFGVGGAVLTAVGSWAGIEVGKAISKKPKSLPSR